MKLPEELNIASLSVATDRLIETIVRDCIRLAIAYGDNGEDNEAGHAIAYEISARYGLEEKK